MDGREQPDALSDEALERELQAVLRVEPSPEFMARVRTAVAAEATAGARGMWPSFALLAAAAAVVVIAGALWMRAEHTGRDADTTIAVQASAAVEAVPRLAPAPVPRSAGVAPKPRASTRRAARLIDRGAPFPEVLIAEDERRGFRMLVAAFEQRRSAAVTDPPVESETPTIALAPIEIPPMPSLARLEGEGE